MTVASRNLARARHAGPGTSSPWQVLEGALRAQLACMRAKPAALRAGSAMQVATRTRRGSPAAKRAAWRAPTANNTQAAARATPADAHPARRVNSKTRPWPNASIAPLALTTARLGSLRAKRARQADTMPAQARQTASRATITVPLAAITAGAAARTLGSASNAPPASTRAVRVTAAALRAGVASTRALRAHRAAVSASKGATKARAVRPRALTATGLAPQDSTILDVAARWRVHALHAREGNSVTHWTRKRKKRRSHVTAACQESLPPTRAAPLAPTASCHSTGKVRLVRMRACAQLFAAPPSTKPRHRAQRRTASACRTPNALPSSGRRARLLLRVTESAAH